MNEENWRPRTALCELLAFSLRFPDPELAQAVFSGEWLDAACELAEVVGLSLPDGFSDQDATADASGLPAPDADVFFHALRTEATRLFIGAPEPAVSPYEGVWRSGDDPSPMLFVNVYSMDVERFCRSCGMKSRAGSNEPLDHIATEMELLEHLSLLAGGIAAPVHGGVSPCEMPGGSAQAAYDLFVEEHLMAWAPCFAERLAEETQLSLYAVVAHLLKAFTAQTRTYFDFRQTIANATSAIPKNR